MRLALAAAAAAFAVLAGCQPDSEKTNPAIASDEAKAARETSAPAAGANSFTEDQARDHAMKAGYTSIGALTQAADGTWQGPATKDGASVTVVVDYQGNVTSNASGASTTPGMTSPDGATSGSSPTPGSSTTPTPDAPH